MFAEEIHCSEYGVF